VLTGKQWWYIFGVAPLRVARHLPGDGEVVAGIERLNIRREAVGGAFCLMMLV
jgi:hypothetical protein